MHLSFPVLVKPHLEFSTQAVRRDWNTSVQVLRSVGPGSLPCLGCRERQCLPRKNTLGGKIAAYTGTHAEKSVTKTLHLDIRSVSHTPNRRQCHSRA